MSGSTSTLPWASMLASSSKSSSSGEEKAAKRAKRAAGPTAGAAAGPVAERQNRCEPCGKNFRTAQGLRTHTHQVHKLKLYDVLQGAEREQGIVRTDLPGAPNPGSAPIVCSECCKEFFSVSDFNQHFVSKHSGRFTETKPDWSGGCTAAMGGAAEAGDEATAATTKRRCAICGQVFPSAMALGNHTLSLAPPEATPEVTCRHCSRRFREERALQQHQNHCQGGSAGESG